MKWFLAIMAFAVLGTASPSFARCDGGEIVIRMSHVNRGFNHPIGNAASELEKRVNTELDGKACMEVYGNSILYTDERVIIALVQNDIQLAVPSYNKLEKYTDAFRLFSLPFMFKNYAAVEDFQSSLTGELLKNALIGKGIRGLGFWHGGFLQMSADRVVTKPTDLKDMVFASTGTQVSIEQFKAVDAKPQSISFAETFAALQNGSVNGTEGTWPNLYDKDLHKVQSGVTETNHAVDGNIILATDKWIKSMPSDVSSVFLTIVQEVTAKQNRDVFDQSEDAKQRILDDGGVIRSLSESRRAEWITAFAPVWTLYSKQVHPRMIDYVKEVNERN